MCGRYTLTVPARLAAVFPAYRFPAVAPRYNIAPTQPVLGLRGGERAAELLVWGMRGNINARAESVAVKPTFRESLRLRRALVFADGYYEWQALGDGKQPFYVRREDGAPFAFAALWSMEAAADGVARHTCALLTTAASPALQPIHHRMPVILRDEHCGAWLSLEPMEADAAAGVVARADDRLRAYPVSLAVNRVSNDDPSLVREVRPPRQGDLFA